MTKKDAILKNELSNLLMLKDCAAQLKRSWGLLFLGLRLLASHADGTTVDRYQTNYPNFSQKRGYSRFTAYRPSKDKHRNGLQVSQ